MISRSFRSALLLIAAISFGLGISLPLMRFEKLWLFSETPSLIEIISDLWTQNEVLLAGIILAFSIVFPIVKLWCAFQAVVGNKAVPVWATALSKWSMLDVLLVAIVVFAAKTSGLASAASQPGLWFFALSAVSVAMATIGTSKRGRKAS